MDILVIDVGGTHISVGHGPEEASQDSIRPEDEC
jgi:hypothetical protein